jgi:hypothetical protein
MYKALRKACNCLSLAVRAVRLSWSNTAAHGCRSVTELPAARQWQRLRSVSGDSAFAPHNSDYFDKVEWGGGAMTVRSTHTTRAFERIPCPIRHTTFVPDLITLRAHRLNANIDSTIIRTYIVAKAERLNQITDNPTNMTLSELL